MLRLSEKEAWRKTPYQIIRMFEYHKEYNPHIFRQKKGRSGSAETEEIDDIDLALGGF